MEAPFKVLHVQHLLDILGDFLEVDQMEKERAEQLTEYEDKWRVCRNALVPLEGLDRTVAYGRKQDRLDCE